MYVQWWQRVNTLESCLFLIIFITGTLWWWPECWTYNIWCCFFLNIYMPFLLLLVGNRGQHGHSDQCEAMQPHTEETAMHFGGKWFTPVFCHTKVAYLHTNSICAKMCDFAAVLCHSPLFYWKYGSGLAEGGVAFYSPTQLLEFIIWLSFYSL